LKTGVKPNFSFIEKFVVEAPPSHSID